MKKMTGRERRAEERRILAEMDEAMAEQAKQASPDQTTPAKKQGKADDTMPEKIHCKRCKTLMENGVCPLCGFTVYMPMAEEKRKKIRWIMTGVCLAVFAVLFVIIQATKG